MATPERDNLDADLSAYLDGELSEERARQVARHVAESEQARRTLAEVREVADQLATLPRQQAPDTLADTTLRHAERRLRSGDVSAARHARVLKLFARVGASAAALIACLFVGWQVLKRPAVVGPAELEPPAAVRSVDELGLLAEATADKAYEQPIAAEPAAEHAERGVPVARGRTPTPTTISGVPVASGRKKATASSEAQPLTTHSFGTVLAEHDAPLVNVWIIPHSDREYAATAAMLDNWTGRDPTSDAAQEAYLVQGRGGGDQKEQLAAGPPSNVAVERVYEFPATELNDRINRLTLNVEAPNQVRVQMNFIAADSDFLVRGGRPPAEAKDAPAAAVRFARRLETLRLGVELQDASTAPLEEPAAEMAEAEKPATGRRFAGRGRPPEVDPKRDKLTAGWPGSAREQPHPAKGQPSPARQPGAAGRRAGGRGGLVPAQPDRERRGVARESEVAAQALAGRSAETPRDTRKGEADGGETADRTMAVLRAPSAASRPVAVEKLPASQPTLEVGAAASQPAKLHADIADGSVSRGLTDRLLWLLFGGPGRDDRAPGFSRSRGAAVQPGGAPVTFRVMLLPPPTGPTSQPATRPATRRTENP